MQILCHKETLHEICESGNVVVDFKLSLYSYFWDSHSLAGG